jgi:4-amino-4-deoxy-L-arabinose transferase-like glycosyltransferase
MGRSLNHRAGHYALLLTAGAMLFLVNLGGPSLWDVDEGRNSGCSLEMLEARDWLIPTFNAELRVDKPALLYWLQMLTYQALGVNELAARLPSALAALLTVLLVYELGRSLFGGGTGLLAGLIFASTPMVCAAARFANPDALLNLFTVLPLLTFWVGYSRARRYLCVPISLGMALAVLAKGPVGVLMPSLVMLAFLTWAGKLRLLWTPRLLLGVVVFCGVALPWYVLVGAETKAEFLRGFFFTHNIGRFRFAMEDHAGGPLYYLVVLVVGMAPWSAFLGLAGWYGLQEEQPRQGRPGRWWALSAVVGRLCVQEDRYRFLWCWIGGYLLFFTASATKLPNYILPLCAPVAVLTGRFLQRWRQGEVDVPGWALRCSLVCLALMGVLTALGLAFAGGWGPLALLPEPHLAGLERWAFIGVFPVLGAAAALWCLRRQRRGGVVLAVTAAAVLLIAPLAAWGVAALDRYKAPRALVAEAGALRRTEEIRVGCYDLQHLPSLTFYCQRTVAYPATWEDAAEFLRTPLPVYLFLPEPAWRGLRARVTAPYRVVGRHPDFYHGCDVVAVTNR